MSCGDHAVAPRGFPCPLERAALGAPSVRKAMRLLQGILRRAVVRGLIASNAVRVLGRGLLGLADRRDGRCWARTSDLRLVETEARGQDLTGQVRKRPYMQAIPRAGLT
jgi:hypothetical protein